MARSRTSTRRLPVVFRTLVPITGASDANDLDAPRLWRAPRESSWQPSLRPAPGRRTVLVLAPDRVLAALIADAIVPYHDVVEADDVVSALKVISTDGSVGVVLAGSCISAAGADCGALARTLYERCPWMPVVCISDVAPTNLKAGALLTGVRALVTRDVPAADLAVLLASVAREHGATVPGEAKIRAIRQTFLLLDAALTDVPPLGELASMAGMSRSHFSRTFHAVAGMTLRDYVRDLRLKRAEHLLRTSDKSLTFIATESGFYDLPHLDKAFRHRLGVSPRMFRSLYTAAA